MINLPSIGGRKSDGSRTLTARDCSESIQRHFADCVARIHDSPNHHLSRQESAGDLSVLQLRRTLPAERAASPLLPKVLPMGLRDQSPGDRGESVSRAHSTIRGRVMMRLKVASVSTLPAPGTAVEVMACDLSRGAGRRAVRLSCGSGALRTLLSRRARFVAVMIGAAGRHVVEYTESEIMEMGGELIDFTKFAAAPIVLTSFGLCPQLRERMLAGAKRRDLETVEPAGRG
jgi:hypothetical protein